MSAPGRTVAAIIPCKDEADRIAATVEAVLALDGVDRVVVVDDGSSDATAAAADAAGASVVVHARNAAKAAALETGVRHLRGLEATDAGEPRHLLFVDGDLEESASNLHVLLPPVLEGRADMTIATLPAQ